MKRKPALIAAFLTTFVIAIVMVLVGANAFFNANSVVIAASPTVVSANDPSGGVVAVSDTTSTGDQVQQLNALIAQYQAREQQYQQREQQYQQQLNDATSQVQQLENVLQQLQSIGVIRIDQNGQISVPRRSGN